MSRPPFGPGSLIAELRRRHVFRVAAAYGVVAWLVIQVAATTLPAFEAPLWVLRVVIALAVLGFPVALVLAWAYELTPEGMRRDPSSEEGGSVGVGSRNALPVMAFGLLALLGVVGYTAFSSRAANATDLRSVAVLPFENMSGNPENEYFSDGVTEDILSHLAKIGELRVVSRTTVMQYKQTAKGLRQIGEELGVAAILEGSVRREGNRIRIVAQLIDARTDEHLWAQTYDRELTDVFAIQSEIAQVIARELHAKLTPAEARRIREAPTRSVEAYDYFLKARKYAGVGGVGRESNELAIALLERAIALDPGFAAAYALLAGGYQFRATEEGGGQRVWVDSALVTARKAIAVAPDQPYGYLALGDVHRRWQGRWGEARRQYLRALDLDPTDQLTLGAIGLLSYQMGDLAEGVEYLERAIADPLDPGEVPFPAHLAAAYSELGLYEPAERRFREVMTLVPENTRFRESWLLHTLRHGRAERANRMLDSLTRYWPDDPEVHLTAAHLAGLQGDAVSARRHLDQRRRLAGGQQTRSYALAERMWGDRALGERLLREIEEGFLQRIAEGHEGWGLHESLAAIAALRGETDRALAHLEAAVDRGLADAWHLRTAPALASLRSEPRFQRLVERLESRAAAMRQQVERRAR
jgi:TolB-like protein/Flp pilus assembly protein TadD